MKPGNGGDLSDKRRITPHPKVVSLWVCLFWYVVRSGKVRPCRLRLLQGFMKQWSAKQLGPHPITAAPRSLGPGSPTCVSDPSDRSEYVPKRHLCTALWLSDYGKSGPQEIRISTGVSYWEKKWLKSWRQPEEEPAS